MCRWDSLITRLIFSLILTLKNILKPRGAHQSSINKMRLSNSFSLEILKLLCSSSTAGSGHLFGEIKEKLKWTPCWGGRSIQILHRRKSSALKCKNPPVMHFKTLTKKKLMVSAFYWYLMFLDDCLENVFGAFLLCDHHVSPGRFISWGTALISALWWCIFQLIQEGF